MAHPLEGPVLTPEAAFRGLAIMARYKHMASLPFDVETRRQKKGIVSIAPREQMGPIQSQLLHIHQSLGWGRYTLCYCYFGQLVTALNTYLISKSRESRKTKSKNSTPPHPQHKEGSYSRQSL